METTALINKKIVKSNWCLKQAQKTEKKLNKKGSRKNLKNYLGKVLLPADQVVGDEERMTGFEATISQTKLLTKLQKANLTGMSVNQFPVH
ncbi:hypothetical protein JZO70_11815 [Enterococcus sp. 669A]|uniref:Transposase n=1 Tax=Candidatus Enterococcus moelleringii TaxID=2815325 RepID=A0ABS3LB34_9ENTE|nr:hypothetical protein [Enterococcus sp. 669A]MBO1306853.1 hypothetical protein [Enterococcus sp. 669A]